MFCYELKLGPVDSWKNYVILLLHILCSFLVCLNLDLHLGYLHDYVYSADILYLALVYVAPAAFPSLALPSFCF